MKLRTRILLFAGITLVCLITGIYLFSSRLLMRSYADLEHQYMVDNVQRAGMAVSQLSADLYVKTVDWSSWDDSYQFMANHNKAFIKSNMVDSGIVAMQLDIVMYLDTKGKIFCAKPVKRLENIARPSPGRMVAALGIEHILAARQDEQGGFYGMIILPEGPMLVTVRPVLTTKGQGPSRGWLIFGRYFDAVALKELAARTRMNIRVWEPNDKLLPEDSIKALTGLRTPAATFIHPVDARTTTGYTLLYDPSNRPVLLLRVTRPRAIYQQGVQSVQYLMRLILIATSVFGLVILLTLEYFAFSRLSKLTRQVKRIRGEDGIARVDLPGGDELTLLADTINGMLITLEQSSQDLRESEERLRVYNDNLEQTVRERTQQIEHQAFHDALTNLPNRALFTDRLQLAHARFQRSHSPIAVIFIDLDNFKMVNDTLGHEAGDQLLRAIAERLTPCIRVGDTLARLGGDEFTILLEDMTGVEIAIEISERILEALSTPMRITTQEIFASASIGIAYQEEVFDTPDVVLRNADTAMYVVKSSGKSGYALFDPTMNDHITGRLEIETSLHGALERGEFSVNYQPLVSLESNHMIGVEALLRWNHPTQGMISPAKFIPIAEDTGMIVPIGYWVLEEACRQMKVWEDEHPEYGAFTMNINLSGKQLQRTDVVDRVRQVLVTTGVDTAHIKLEITESVMMTDMDTAIERLHGLKALGVKLAMDDFGTGYSCMANMTKFPLDTIKIDRAFIQRLTNQEVNSKHMVEAIIALSKALHLDVTGEGVETLQQATYLKSLGCDIAQGYYYAHALTPDALTAFITAGPKSLAQSSLSRPEGTQADPGRNERYTPGGLFLTSGEPTAPALLQRLPWAA
jgi:diguanylate cyclase (GGDEF)-like protein